MSLLTIVQQAMGELGLGTPPTVVSNADAGVQRALALCNRAALTLRNDPAAADYWPVLRRQYLFNLAGQGPFTGTFTNGSSVITGVVFTGSGSGWAALAAGWQISSKYVINDTMIAVGGINQGGQTITMTQPANVPVGTPPQTDTALSFGQEAYNNPADLRYFIPGTGWDRNFRWQLLGPLNAQEWQVVKSGISPVGPRLRYRLMQNQIYVNPAPFLLTGSAGQIAQTDLIVMEYVSTFWCGPTGSTVPTQVSFALDTDICQAFPEDLITLSLKWRILKAIGNSYAEEYDEYEKELQKEQGRQTMGRALPLNARAGQLRLINSQQVPDTGFGS